jgi:thiol-disulfide isomerase/thioredoxin
VPCLPRSERRHARRWQRRHGRRAAAAALAAAGVLGLAACSGGASAQSSATGNGQDFVSGEAGTTVFQAGSAPVAPKVSGTTLTGGKLSLATYRGHVVVLNFWGSWCPPCRAEAPSLAALARRFQPAGVHFVGVDIRDNTAAAEAFMHDFGITYPSFSDPGDVIALAFRSTVPPAGTPTTLVIGRGGRIIARVVGEASQAGLAGIISRAATKAS